MLDAVLVPLEDLMTSWWVYPALFALCAVDAFIPVFPSEAPLIMAGVYAASDANGPSLVGAAAAAMLGAALGDHVSYGIGRLAGARTAVVSQDGDDGPRGTGKRARTLTAVAGVLHERGSWALLVVRFIPGGRSLGTLSLGAARYPLLTKFTPYDLVATSLWALHGCVIGYVGGRAFESNPVAGILTGLGLALVAAALIEWWQRRGSAPRAARSNR